MDSGLIERSLRACCPIPLPLQPPQHPIAQHRLTPSPPVVPSAALGPARHRMPGICGCCAARGSGLSPESRVPTHRVCRGSTSSCQTSGPGRALAPGAVLLMPVAPCCAAGARGCCVEIPCPGEFVGIEPVVGVEVQPPGADCPLQGGAWAAAAPCRVSDGELGHGWVSHECYADRIPIFFSVRRIYSFAWLWLKYHPVPQPTISR